MYKGREVIDYLEDVLMAMEKAEAFTLQMSYAEFLKEDIHQIKPDMADILNNMRQDSLDHLRTDAP